MNRRPSDSDLVNFKAEARGQIEQRAYAEFIGNKDRRLETFICESDSGVAAAVAVSLAYKALNGGDADTIASARAALARLLADFTTHRVDDAEDAGEVDDIANAIADHMRYGGDEAAA